MKGEKQSVVITHDLRGKLEEDTFWLEAKWNKNELREVISVSLTKSKQNTIWVTTYVSFRKQKYTRDTESQYFFNGGLSPLFLLIINLINKLRLHHNANV